MSKKMSTNRSKLVLISPSPVAAVAAEIIASNVDLLTEILYRVPAKPLIRFKCVSKHWLSLISDPQFARHHTRRKHTPSVVSGLYIHSNRRHTLPLNDKVVRVSLGGGGHRRSSSVPTLSFLERVGSGSTTTRVSHSSNGLMLCEIGRRIYMVCNLTTQKFIALPKASDPLPGSYFLDGSYLVFDPTKSPHYKVVLVNCCSDLNICQLDIYSSEGASWKTVHLAPSIKSFMLHGVVWNGAIVWMRCEYRRSKSCLRHGHVYLRLDVDAEKLTTTRVAKDPNLSKGILYFGECGGHLLLVQLPSFDATKFRVLEMDADEFRWNVKYRVDLTPLVFPHRSKCIISVISVVKGGKENDLVVVFYNQGKVISYNLEHNTWEVLCDISPGDVTNIAQNSLYKYSHQFIESLSPV